jgi:hypothetical protein
MDGIYLALCVLVASFAIVVLLIACMSHINGDDE